MKHLAELSKQELREYARKRVEKKLKYRLELKRK